MSKQQPTLEQRIDAALQPDAVLTSADLDALIEEADAAIAEAEEACAVERTYSLDPTAARQAIEDAKFAVNRLRELRSKLETRYKQVYSQEQATAWLTEFEVMKRGRDALAEELCQVYPDMVAKVVDVFLRIVENDQALSKFHQARPAGVSGQLVSAELHARGLDRITRDKPSLLDSVHLIDWESGREIWPPPRPSMAAAFASVIMPYDRQRFSADWAKYNERHAAAQREEQQRMAEYYARMTKEQEDRENAEARERFLEQQARLSVNRPVKL